MAKSSSCHLPITMPLDISPGKFVTSSDGTKIWAAACGNTSKPAVVFIHGFMCTADVFDKQYTNTTMLENLYIVCDEVSVCLSHCIPTRELRFAMTFGDVDEVKGR